MKKTFDAIAAFIAAGFGLGYLVPFGQGTLAAAAAAFLVRPFLRLPTTTQLLLIIVAVVGGILTSSVAERAFNKKDDHKIVVDEIVSVFVTFAFLPATISAGTIVLGLALNRVLDWWKPHPIRALQMLPGGWGVMIDDLLSAAYAAVLLRLILTIG